MRNSRSTAFIFGAASGGAIALVALILAIGRTALGAITTIEGTTTIEITTGALYLMIVTISAVVGLLIGAIGYATSLTINPEAERFPIRYLLPVGAVTASLLSYALLRMGLGALSEINGGTVAIRSLHLTLIVLIIGVIAGGVTGVTTDVLARPALFGFEGEAWPHSGREVITAMTSAVGVPVVAAFVAAVVAIPLSIVLIELSGNAAVVFFSIVGTVILGGASLVAARPWDKETP